MPLFIEVVAASFACIEVVGRCLAFMHRDRMCLACVYFAHFEFEVTAHQWYYWPENCRICIFDLHFGLKCVPYLHHCEDLTQNMVKVTKYILVHWFIMYALTQAINL